MVKDGQQQQTDSVIGKIGERGRGAGELQDDWTCSPSFIITSTCFSGLTEGCKLKTGAGINRETELHQRGTPYPTSSLPPSVAAAAAAAAAAAPAPARPAAAPISEWGGEAPRTSVSGNSPIQSPAADGLWDLQSSGRQPSRESRNEPPAPESRRRQSKAMISNFHRPETAGRRRVYTALGRVYWQPNRSNPTNPISTQPLSPLHRSPPEKAGDSINRGAASEGRNPNGRC